MKKMKFSLMGLLPLFVVATLFFGSCGTNKKGRRTEVDSTNTAGSLKHSPLLLDMFIKEGYFGPNMPNMTYSNLVGKGLFTSGGVITLTYSTSNSSADWKGDVWTLYDRTNTQKITVPVGNRVTVVGFDGVNNVIFVEVNEQKVKCVLGFAVKDGQFHLATPFQQMTKPDGTFYLQYEDGKLFEATPQSGNVFLAFMSDKKSEPTSVERIEPSTKPGGSTNSGSQYPPSGTVPSGGAVQGAPASYGAGGTTPASQPKETQPAGTTGVPSGTSGNKTTQPAGSDVKNGVY